MRRLGLPRYQYTIEDVKSGTLIGAFSDALGVNYAEMAVDRYCEHLTGHGVDMRVRWYFRRIVARGVFGDYTQKG